MRRILVVVAGFSAGIVLAGLVSAALILILPPHLRGTGLVWATTTITVGITTAAAWGWLSGHRG